ncbi:MAG: CAP domain-containing protein [Anaerolineae bacterium]|nr:CAP domain-containing protein [Anaerolineae bacterium]
MMRVLKLAILWLLLAGLLPVQAQDTVSDLLGRINGLRASVGLAPYTLNAALAAAARNHADWMATSGEVSHVQPDGSRPRDRAAASGYVSPWVSENIYAGINATPDVAWSFWVNSPVHYAGLTNPTYTDVGIASATGTLRAYVLVFGAPPERAPGRRIATGTGSSGSAAAGSSAPAAPPSFVVGVDAVGHIMHEVQPDDTLGDIAFTYGYNWDVIPTLLAINGMTEDDIRLLKQGSVILVPPQDGTYTPTAAPPTATATITPAVTASATLPPPVALVLAATSPARLPALPPPATYIAPTASPTAALLVRPVPTPPAAAPADPAPPPDARPALLVLALIVQACILAAAGVELLRRHRRS